MAKTFGSPLAFKTSLDERLRKEALARATPLIVLRLKMVIERLLARLFTDAGPPWILKGGYAMELRYRPRARTTRDIDLTVNGELADTLDARLKTVRDQLQAAAETDLGDYFTFFISAPQTELAGAPLGGARFPVEAKLAGKTYERFHIDVGFGDAVVGSPELLTGDDLLGFAGIKPAVALVLPRAQQFAEKIHAYTKPWSDRTNTRSKDLVDVLVLIARGLAPDESLRSALHATFAVRGTHPLPATLAPPPEEWRADFTEMAAVTGLESTDLAEGYSTLRRYWTENELGRGGSTPADG